MWCFYNSSCKNRECLVPNIIWVYSYFHADTDYVSCSSVYYTVHIHLLINITQLFNIIWTKWQTYNFCGMHFAYSHLIFITPRKSVDLRIVEQCTRAVTKWKALITNAQVFVWNKFRSGFTSMATFMLLLHVKGKIDWHQSNNGKNSV